VNSGTPQGERRAAINRIDTKRVNAGGCLLTLLGPAGGAIGDYFVYGLALKSAKPSAHGADPGDLTASLWADNIYPMTPPRGELLALCATRNN
jgi:hypothetical protein